MTWEGMSSGFNSYKWRDSLEKSNIQMGVSLFHFTIAEGTLFVITSMVLCEEITKQKRNRCPLETALMIMTWYYQIVAFISY